MHPGLQVIIGLLLVDVLTATMHWYEDNYLPPSTTKNPLLREIAIHNEIHHVVPYSITTFTPLENIMVPLLLTTCVFGVMWLVWPNGFRKYPYLLLVTGLAGTFSNLLHRWLHERPCKRPALIQLLQRIGIIVRSDVHALHHRDTTGGKAMYGVIFSPMNDLYDTLGIWRGLEWVLANSVGIHPMRKLGVQEFSKQYAHLNPSKDDPCPDPPSRERLIQLSNAMRQH